jgi:bacteriocin biosynthesis cyclodehydratase domain-containing protein
MYERPRLKQTTQRAESGDGDIYLLRPSRGQDLRIVSPTDTDRRLLAALDGRSSHEELVARFGGQAVQDCLGQLEKLDALEDAVDDDRIPKRVWARFDRQLRYFSDISEGRLPSECQRSLEEARVAVLGVGGLGGWSALALACHGIGEMLLVDFDRVELNNLNRQVLYGEADIGRSKARVAAERLGAFNSSMRLEVREERLDSEAAVAAAIAGADVVIDAVDWPALDIERWVNSACFRAAIPFVAMSHFPPIARVGPFYVPGQTGCYACQETAYRNSYPLYDVVVEQQRAKPSPAATLGAACALIGGHVALDIVHYLTGLAEPSSQGVSHIFDLRTMEIEREQVVPIPNCSVCGEASQRANGSVSTD